LITIKNKICFLGNSGVGKSSLVSLLQGREVLKERSPTVGLEIGTTYLSHLGKYLNNPIGAIRITVPFPPEFEATFLPAIHEL
jgi:GTPase SAR1 family protein